MISPGDSFGNYKVVRKLGQGGMGEVWLLESASGKQVAAKFLDPVSAGDHEARKRFLREAQLAINVKHPNLVETYDVGEDPDTGLCYILMEYVSGGSLADYLKEQGALPIEDAVAVVEAMAGVLEVGRQKGIVHRDIKPANIMFDEEGTPKLADLGIARGGSAGTETTTVTQTGMMIGTPAYMAPEQMLDAHNVDTRADIYSLGVVFFEMLTGERPNKDDTVVQLMAKAVKGEPLPDVRTLRPEVSASIAQLLAMMVAPDKEGRISTPGQITNALGIIERGGKLESVEAIAHRQAEARAARKPRRGHRLALITVLFLAAIIGLAGIGVGVWMLMREDTHPTTDRRGQTKMVVHTNVVERVIEKTRVVTNAQRNTSGKSVQSRRPKVDRRVRIATVDDHDWYYTLEDDNAVIWRGENGYNSETRPAVRPEPTEHVTIPSVLDGHPVVALGSLAFFRCRKMTSVTIPEGVVRIDGWAFLDCTALNRVDVPESLRTLKPTAFCSCVSLTGIDLKNCVEFDGRSFYNCTKLDEVRIGKGRDELSTVDGALYADAGRRLVFWPRTRSSVSLPDGVKTIGGGAFQGCLASRIVLPKSVSELANFAFDGCHNLEEVVLNEGIVSVGDYAFNMCYRLRAVVFPASLQRLGHDVFSRASAIRYVAFLGNAPEIGDVNRQSVFGKTQDSSEIVVRKGTTGWKSSGSTELPRLWPHEKMADSRPIRAVSDDEIVRLSTGLGRQEVLSGSSSASFGSEWQPGPSDKWFVNWDEALADARKNKRSILVLNTGSTWCHWCKKLRAEVLDKDEFKAFVDAKLTLLYLDSPCRNVAQRNHNKQVVKALKFSGGVPNVRVYDTDGGFLGTVGGGGLSVDKYIAKLREIIAGKAKKVLDENGRILFSDGYAALAKKIAEERAKLPKVARSDFKAKLVGVAVVANDNRSRWNKEAEFLPPETHIKVPFGKTALFKVEYDFPNGYEARVWTRDEWPSEQRRNSSFFGSNPSRLYKGKGVTTGFLSLLERGKECNLKTLAIRTSSEPEIDDETREWKIAAFPVDITFLEKAADGLADDAGATQVNGNQGRVDPEAFRDPDATKATQKAFDALFPGWKVSAVEQSDANWAFGYQRSWRGRDDVISTAPPKMEVPVIINKRVKLDLKCPLLVVEVASQNVDTDFLLSVRVNGKSMIEPRAVCTPNDASYARLHVPLMAYRGKTVNIEIVQTANNWFYEHAFWSKIEIAEGTGKETSGIVGVKRVEVFPAANPENKKWLRRSPWRYSERDPGDGWKEPSFDDSKWQRSNRAFGRDKNMGMSVANVWKSERLWLRRKFNWDVKDAVYNAIFNLYYDEHVEIFLNGMPVTEQHGWNFGWFEYAAWREKFIAALRQGENTLAVTLKGDGASYFDCGLTIETCEQRESASLPGKVRGGDPGSLQDKDSTRRVQKALDALFPGWKTSQNAKCAVHPNEELGYIQKIRGKSDVLATLPPSKTDPVVLSRTMVLPQQAKLSFSVRKNPTAGGGFTLQVYANGQRRWDGLVNEGKWLEQTVDLSDLSGKETQLKILHLSHPDYGNARALWSRLEVK